MLSTLGRLNKLTWVGFSRNVTTSIDKGWTSGALRLGSAPWQSRKLCTRELKDGRLGADENSLIAEDDSGIVENQFEGKQTREQVHKAFASRAGDLVRYEYFAQRAELESETDAAPLFRSLAESARQQAMGYLELMEEYGDSNFGSTTENLDYAVEAERSNAQDKLSVATKIAAEEGFEHVEEWFEDMTNASYRAASKIEQVQSILEDEMIADELHEDADEDHDFDQKRH